MLKSFYWCEYMKDVVVVVLWPGSICMIMRAIFYINFLHFIISLTFLLLYCLPHAIKTKSFWGFFLRKKKLHRAPKWFLFYFHYEFLHAIIVSPAHFEINMRHPIVLNKFFSFFPSPYIHFRYICGCILLHMCDVSCKFHILNFFDILNW